jgi:hypothetical protein
LAIHLRLGRGLRELEEPSSAAVFHNKVELIEPKLLLVSVLDLAAIEKKDAGARLGHVHVGGMGPNGA